MPFYLPDMDRVQMFGEGRLAAGVADGHWALSRVCLIALVISSFDEE